MTDLVTDPVDRNHFGVESKNVGVESKNVGVESKYVGVENKNVVLPHDRIVILQMILENPHITAKELATKLHTTTRTAERIFRQLKQSGKIRREGSDCYGHWIVIE